MPRIQHSNMRYTPEHEHIKQSLENGLKGCVTEFLKFGIFPTSLSPAYAKTKKNFNSERRFLVLSSILKECH